MIFFRETWLFLPLVVLLASIQSASTAAQELEVPAHKQGYYISAEGIGTLAIHTTSDGTMKPMPGPGFRLRLGEALSKWFDLGIGGGVSWGYVGDYRSLQGNFSLEGTIKPTEYLFVQLGAGLGFTDFTRRKDGVDKVVGRFGGEYTVTVGYDFFPGQYGKENRSGGFALTPLVGAFIGPEKPTGTYSVFVGLRVTWWSGLDKNKLVLPIDEAYQ